MATDKETYEGSVENIKDILTNDVSDHSAKLRVVQHLKKLFRPPDQIFSKLKLDSLLQGSGISLKSTKLSKDFLYHYGTSLIGFLGRDYTLDSELLSQLEYILMELKKEDKNLTDALVIDVLKRFEDGFSFQLDGILDASKQTIEKIVLDWVDTPTAVQLEFLSKRSVNSPKVFQTLTSVLYEILVKTRGHHKVFELTDTFITSVKLMCKNEGKHFLGLYPKGCGRLVALLMVSPEIYIKENGEVFNEILSLLSEMFSTDRQKALILLSHYSKWVSHFKVYLEENKALSYSL